MNELISQIAQKTGIGEDKARQAAETGLACFYTGQATAHDDPRILARHIERAFDQLQG